MTVLEQFLTDVPFVKNSKTENMTERKEIFLQQNFSNNRLFCYLNKYYLILAVKKGSSCKVIPHETNLRSILSVKKHRVIQKNRKNLLLTLICWLLSAGVTLPESRYFFKFRLTVNFHESVHDNF